MLDEWLSAKENSKTRVEIPEQEKSTSVCLSIVFVVAFCCPLFLDKYK